MKSKAILLFVLFVLFSNGALAQKAKRAKQVEKAQTALASALLYKVTGKGMKQTSYLFGTMHLTCSEDVTFMGKVRPYLNGSDQLMLEVDMSDPSVTAEAALSSIMKDGKTIKDLLEPEEFAKLDEIYKEYLGISVTMLERFKPIMVSSVLFTSPKIVGCPEPAKMDSDLAVIAKSLNKGVVGLETVKDQIDVLDTTPIADQVKSLKDIVSDLDGQMKIFRDLYRVYLSQDSDKLYELMHKDSTQQPAFMNALLDDRNKKWIPIIESNIKSTSSFIAFGAGHLGGKNGVVALLRARGYVVTPIRL